MTKPIKCKCGKMISRPKANKSGLCYTCNFNKLKQDAKRGKDE